MSGNRYSEGETQGFIDRVNHPIPAEGDTMTAGDYPPLSPPPPSTYIAYPITPFGDMATTDGLADLTTAELSPDVQAQVDAIYGKAE